jgi:glycosyltransferase involved in cell wall biosynthesis
MLLSLILAPLIPLYGISRKQAFMPFMFGSHEAFATGAYALEENRAPARADVEADGNITSSVASPQCEMAPATGCLAMIIKNEGPILPRLFDSVRGFVSEYCVVDTGSTDDTIDVLKSMEMPGVILEEPFVDFATTRNYMIDTCRKVMTSCDYLVLLDADMVLRVSPEWDWAKLDGRDVYNLVQISGVEYENVRMIRRDATEIRVVGATHEYYDVPAKYTRDTLPKGLLHINDVGDGKAKGDKFERDERLLHRELEKDPDNVRTVFYLANTLKDQGKHAEAIPFYERRVTMGGWFAEADYSQFMLSTCYLGLNDLDNARKYAELAAFAGAVKRAEPLYFLAFYLRQQGQYKMAYYYATLAAKIPKPGVADALFISNDIYNFWVDYEIATLCRHILPSQYLAGMRAALTFWDNVHAPQDLRESFASLMKPYVRSMTLSGPEETYHYESLGREMALTMSAGEGHMNVLLPKIEEGIVELGILHLDARQSSAKHQESGTLHIDTRLPDYDIPDIIWQFVEPRHVFGHSALKSHVYHGKWSEDSDNQVPLRRLTTSGQVSQSWNLVARRGVVYCITKWYPTIEVGILRTSSSDAVCEAHASVSQIPRTFSFFSTTIHGITYREDFWFLVQVDALDAFAMVVLSPDFKLKAYTPPFTMELPSQNGNEAEKTPLGFDIVTRENDQEHVMYAFASRISNNVIIKPVLVDEMLTWMI